MVSIAHGDAAPTLAPDGALTGPGQAPDMRQTGPQIDPRRGMTDRAR